MGRRKIEIQPITHERNRSVTFLKRKNGLFKKAYELGVLCSVDIAVIVFEERPGHHPKLYQYCSTDINELVQRHIRHQGEKDARGPGDFANAPAGKFDEEEGDDDEPDDEEEYTPNRASKRRKVKKSSRTVNADDFEQGGMSIPQPPMNTMHGASSHPISSDRHALTDDPNAVASYPPGFQPGAPGFRPNYPFFPPGHPAGFMPPPGWDGRGDYPRRFDAAGAPAGAPYPIPPGVLAQQGPNSGPGNLFAFLEEQQRRAAAGGAGIEWPDPAQAPPQSTAAPGSGSEWLDFLSPRNNAASGGGNTAGPPGGSERSPATAAAAESWERGGSAGSLPPKLRTSAPASKEGSDSTNEEKEKDDAAGDASAGGARGTKRAANGKSAKGEGKVKKEG